jgi:carbonic anhydrase
MGNLTEMLSKIKPAVEALSSETGDKTSHNKDFVQKVCDENIKLTIEKIRKDSPILKEMESKGEIKILGAMYSLEDGIVTFFEENK